MNEICSSPLVGMIVVTNPDLLLNEFVKFIKDNAVAEVFQVIPLTVAVPKKVASMLHANNQPDVEYQFRFIIIYL